MITACGSLFLLYLVKVTLPKTVWVSDERREKKCLCWVSGCSSASGHVAGQTVRPASTPLAALGETFLMTTATWGHLRARGLPWSLLQPEGAISRSHPNSGQPKVPTLPLNHRSASSRVGTCRCPYEVLWDIRVKKDIQCLLLKFDNPSKVSQPSVRGVEERPKSWTDFP